MPVALDDLSEPEPDTCIVRGRIERYVGGHPTAPVLVVEAAGTSLRRDWLRKAAIYARAGVGAYWVVNLVESIVEVDREPTKTASGRWRYRSIRLLRRGARVTPLAAPRAQVRVSALLP